MRKIADDHLKALFHNGQKPSTFHFISIGQLKFYHTLYCSYSSDKLFTHNFQHIHLINIKEQRLR